MSTVKINPFVYIFPAIILGIVAIYYLYGAVDRLGLNTSTVNATVISKNFTKGSTTYISRIAGGRTWTQAQKQAGFYVINVRVNQERTIALVSKREFDTIKKNDQVKVKIQRTRISGRLEVLDLRTN